MCEVLDQYPLHCLRYLEKHIFKEVFVVYKPMISISTWKGWVSTWSKLDGCTDKRAYPVLSSHYNVL